MVVSRLLWLVVGQVWGGGSTYRQKTLNRMTQWKWKMLAMPSAKQRITHSTPVLCVSSQLIRSFRCRFLWARDLPLAVYAEVPRPQLVCERHCEWCMGGLSRVVVVKMEFIERACKCFQYRDSTLCARWFLLLNVGELAVVAYNM